jgi:hypothetical protein
MKQACKALLLSLLFLPILFSSCASTPTVAEPKAILTLETQESLKNHKLGLTFDTNPYLEPKKSFGNKPDEFVVLRLDIDLPAPTRVELEVSVTGPDGEEVADFKDSEKLKFYWGLWAKSRTDPNGRDQCIFRTYIPSLDFKGRRGHMTYYILCRGEAPIPRPCAVDATVVIDGQKAAELHDNLPPLPEKAKKKKK